MIKRRQLSAHGFTLVELLIVVAIIGILAGIAASNYSLAQVRAKVSATKNDMKVVATALEAYAADNSRYPPAIGVGASYNPFGDFAEPNSARMTALTTPVSYVSTIPTDPFKPKDGWGYPDLDQYDTYDYVDADAVPERGAALTSGGEWRLASAGPDLYQAYGGRPVANPDANSRGVDYDATNGTVSVGDIVRVGPTCDRYGDPVDTANPNRPGIARTPRYVEQWQ